MKTKIEAQKQKITDRTLINTKTNGKNNQKKHNRQPPGSTVYKTVPKYFEVIR